MPLSKEDRDLIKRLETEERVVLPKDQSVTDVTYMKQGSFTIALVTIHTARRKDDLIAVGVAKRNCDDDPGDVDRRGKDIALARALRGDAKPA